MADGEVFTGGNRAGAGGVDRHPRRPRAARGRLRSGPRRRDPRARRPGRRLRHPGARAGHAARLPLRLAPVRRLVRPPRAAGAERRSPSGRHVPDRRGRAPRTPPPCRSTSPRSSPPTAWSACRSTPATRASPCCWTASAGARAPARPARRRRSRPRCWPAWSGAQPGTPLGLRNRAILLAGFGGALRRSEIVGLDVGDLEFVDGRGVVLTVRRSKTDQHGAGRRSRSGAPTTRTCALPPPCAAGWSTGPPATPTTPCSSACAPAA